MIGMKILIALLLTAVLTVPAQAACYADYKAKQDDPLRLHYGVAQVPDDSCNVAAAAKVLAPRLEQKNWTLLTVLSVFSEAQLNTKKEAAGAFFLRY